LDKEKTWLPAECLESVPGQRIVERGRARTRKGGQKHHNSKTTSKKSHARSHVTTKTPVAVVAETNAVAEQQVERSLVRGSEDRRSQIEDHDTAGNEDTRVIEWIRECHSPGVNLMDDADTKVTGTESPQFLRLIVESTTATCSTPPENLLEFPDPDDQMNLQIDDKDTPITRPPSRTSTIGNHLPMKVPIFLINTRNRRNSRNPIQTIIPKTPQIPYPLPSNNIHLL
jgi:hypothetical protein